MMQTTTWLERWDAQQSAYLPTREARFSAMLETLTAMQLEGLLPENFRALDLCAGPGSISERLLRRFPQAQVVALDFDPVLLALGKQHLGNAGGRLTWHEADLRSPDWAQGLGEFQAVLTTTALHWLSHQALQQAYSNLASLMPTGAVLQNGDHFAFSPHESHFAQIALRAKQLRQDEAWANGAEDWAMWWAAIAQDPQFQDLYQERERRFPTPTVRYAKAANFAFHEACLRDVGFREVGSFWQHMDNRILMAIR
jgi:trans-aconitate methyltransferase